MRTYQCILAARAASFLSPVASNRSGGASGTVPPARCPEGSLSRLSVSMALQLGVLPGLVVRVSLAEVVVQLEDLFNGGCGISGSACCIVVGGALLQRNWTLHG